MNALLLGPRHHASRALYFSTEQENNGVAIQFTHSQ
jgi:hypothetical protein